MASEKVDIEKAKTALNKLKEDLKIQYLKDIQGNLGTSVWSAPTKATFMNALQKLIEKHNDLNNKIDESLLRLATIEANQKEKSK